MRAGGCFGVVLDAERRIFLVADALDRVIVQVGVRHFQVVWQRVAINRESVVLGRDFDLAGLVVHDRLVGTAVPELELVRLGATRQRQELVAEADAKDRLFAKQSADGFLGVSDRFRIAGAVGEEDAVRIQGQNFVSGCRAGQDRDAAAHIEQVPGDVVLHAEIEGHDVWIGVGNGLSRFILKLIPRTKRLVPLVRFFRDYLFDQVTANQAGGRFGFCHEACVIQVDRGENPSHGAFVSEFADEGPCVDSFDSQQVVAFEVGVEILFRSEIAGDSASLSDNEAGEERSSTLDIFAIEAIVPNFRIGHRHNLAPIARVGQDFLVAGHARVEADFALDFAFGAERGSCHH